MVTTHGFLLIFKIQCVWPWIGGDTWNRKTGAGLNVRNLWSNTGRAALVTLLSHSYIYVLLLFFSSQSCLTLCHPMDHSMPGFPVLHHLPELAQTHVLWVGDAVWPSHPFSCPQSFPAGPLVYSRLHPALPLFALYCSLLYILKKPLSFSSNSNSTSWIHIK